MSSSFDASGFPRTNRQVRGASGVRWLCAAACACLTLVVAPRSALAVETSKQEFGEAVHSRPSIERGAGLYRPCAGCHGATGAGVPNGWVPRIGGQLASVLQQQLTDYRHNRR